MENQLKPINVESIIGILDHIAVHRDKSSLLLDVEQMLCKLVEDANLLEQDGQGKAKGCRTTYIGNIPPLVFAGKIKFNSTGQN